MNAPAQIIAAIPLVDFDVACARLNQWRGQLIENFARAEQAVTETLALLNTTSPAVRGAKFPHLIGQRYDSLERLLAATEPQSGHIAVTLAALAKFRCHDSLRTMLCHGVTKVAVDRTGGWVALITLMSFKAAGCSTEKLTLLESEGESLLRKVVIERRRLTSALGQVRRETLLAA